jgi:replicative DNA helicase
MIDNRLVEDVQIRLKPHHFFEPLHGRIYEAVLRMTDKNMVANPVTLKPIFDADEAMKDVGGPAYLAQLTGSGAAVIGARDFAAQIYDLALLRALVGVGRDMVEGALDTSEEVAPLTQIERAESELYRVAEEGGTANSVKSFGEATRLALEQAEKALNSGGHLSGLTTGLDGINTKVGGMHKSDLVILAGRPGMGKTSLATNMAFAAAQRFIRDQKTESTRPKAPARRSPSSAWKCQPTSWRRASLPSSRASARKTFAWERSASRNSARWPERRASFRLFRSTSTTPRASPSPRSAPALAA